MIKIYDPFKTVCEAYENYIRRHRLKRDDIKIYFSDDLLVKTKSIGYAVKHDKIHNWVVTIDTSLPLIISIETLAHELAHVADNAEHKHGKIFKDIYKMILKEALENLEKEVIKYNQCYLSYYNHGWISPLNKNLTHFFIDGQSLCGKCTIDKNFTAFLKTKDNEKLCKSCDYLFGIMRF